MCHGLDGRVMVINFTTEERIIPWNSLDDHADYSVSVKSLIIFMKMLFWHPILIPYDTVHILLRILLIFSYFLFLFASRSSLHLFWRCLGNLNATVLWRRWHCRLTPAAGRRCHVTVAPPFSLASLITLRRRITKYCRITFCCCTLRSRRTQRGHRRSPRTQSDERRPLL